MTARTAMARPAEMSSCATCAAGSLPASAAWLALAAGREGGRSWAALAAAVGVALVGGVLMGSVAIKAVGRCDPSADVGWILTTVGVSLIAIGVSTRTIGA